MCVELPSMFLWRWFACGIRCRLIKLAVSHKFYSGVFHFFAYCSKCNADKYSVSWLCKFWCWKLIFSFKHVLYRLHDNLAITPQVLAVKATFEKNINDLYLLYLKSPKHGESSICRFWDLLNYNNFYSTIFNKGTQYFSLWSYACCWFKIVQLLLNLLLAIWSCSAVATYRTVKRCEQRTNNLHLWNFSLGILLPFGFT